MFPLIFMIAGFVLFLLAAIIGWGFRTLPIGIQLSLIAAGLACVALASILGRSGGAIN